MENDDFITQQEAFLLVFGLVNFSSYLARSAVNEFGKPWSYTRNALSQCTQRLFNVIKGGEDVPERHDPVFASVTERNFSS